MSVLFNHGRYQSCDRNPIQLVRKSAKRKAVPVVLSPMEVQRLLSALALRERTLVLVAFGTRLHMSELFALKWRDVNFQINESAWSDRSFFRYRVHAKPKLPRNQFHWILSLAEALLLWRQQTPFKAPDDWVIASPRRAANPLLGPVHHANFHPASGVEG